MFLHKRCPRREMTQNGTHPTFKNSVYHDPKPQRGLCCTCDERFVPGDGSEHAGDCREAQFKRVQLTHDYPLQVQALQILQSSHTNTHTHTHTHTYIYIYIYIELQTAQSVSDVLRSIPHSNVKIISKTWIHFSNLTHIFISLNFQKCGFKSNENPNFCVPSQVCVSSWCWLVHSI